MNGSNLSENKQQKYINIQRDFSYLLCVIGDLLQEIERGSISRLNEESLTITTGTYMEVKSNSKWSTIYHWFHSTVQIVPIYLLVITGNHETTVEAKDGEINGKNNEQLWEHKVRRALTSLCIIVESKFFSLSIGLGV